MDISSTLSRLGGVAAAGELVRRGFGPGAIVRAAGAGLIIRIRRGYYAVPGAPADLIAAARLGVRLTCLSAAPFLGLGTLVKPGALHVASTSGRAAPGAICHRLPAMSSRASAFVVTPLDCVVHGLHCLPEPDALVLAESAVAQRRVRLPDVLDRLPGPANGPARRIVGRVDPRSGSVLETVARRGFLGAGFEVQTQVDIRRVGRVDFVINGCLIVEVDGYDFHSDPKAFAGDRHRSNSALEQGVPTLRFTYFDVMRRLDDVIAQVRRVLDLLGEPAHY